MKSNCEPCAGVGVVVEERGKEGETKQRISVPCKKCSGKKCPTCGRRIRSKNHKCYRNGGRK